MIMRETKKSKNIERKKEKNITVCRLAFLENIYTIYYKERSLLEKLHSRRIVLNIVLNISISPEISD